MCIPGSLKESLVARMNDDERNISEKDNMQSNNE